MGLNCISFLTVPIHEARLYVYLVISTYFKYPSPLARAYPIEVFINQLICLYFHLKMRSKKTLCYIFHVVLIATLIRKI